MNFVETYQWFWIDAVICTLTFIIQTGLFMLQLFVSLQNRGVISFCNCKHFDICEKRSKQRNMATTVTLLALFFYFIYGVDVFLSRIDSLFGEYFHKNTLITCDVFVRIGTISYQLSKGCIYCVFVLRLKLAFAGSTYSYSDKLLKCLVSIIIVYTTMNAINGYLFVNGNKTYIYTPHTIDQSFYTCQTEIHIYVILYLVLFDVIFTAICMFMFIKPLTKIINRNVITVKDNQISNSKLTTNLESNMVSASHIKITKEFKAIIVKYTIISCVALLSTFCAVIIIGITNSPAFSMIDVWINAVCLLIFDDHYEKFYKILCCGLIHCVNSKETINNMAKSLNLTSVHSKSVKRIENDINNDTINNGNNMQIASNPTKLVKIISITTEKSASLSLIEDYNQTDVAIDRT